MDAYNIGRALFIKLASDNAAANVGTIGGATLGGALGSLGGRALADHIGKETRTQILGMGIPFTGAGESFFGHPKGAPMGELLGGITGATLGGMTGHNLGLLRNPHGRQLVHQNGKVDPQLLAYLQGQG